MGKGTVIGVSICVGAVCIGLGVVIGYFTHPGEPSWVGNVESYLRDVNDDDITEFINAVRENNIRENLKFIAEEPHMATSPRDVELAEYIRDQWLTQLDEAYLTPYQIMHGFLNEDPAKPNSVTVTDDSGDVFYEARMTEEVYPEVMANPESIVPYFSAFGPPGDVKGKLVFANFGSDEDYVALQAAGVNLTGTIALVKYGGGVGRNGKAANGLKYGVVGSLVYSDPESWVVAGEQGYPEDSSLPGSGVQRGAALGEFGDPSTPGYASTDYAYRVPLEDIDLFPPIPLQPIGYETAQFFLNEMGGFEAPTSFTTGLQVAENWKIGPGFASPNETREVRLVANNKYETVESNNVIGIIRGREEPDRYVMYGNHRDSWVYGAVDPGSGTACMMEITRIFGEMLADGWRPRRSIVFGSWGSEEFGLLGSTEWAEDNKQLLNERALSYINVDIAVFANVSFFTRASPLLTTVMYEAAQRVKDFHGDTVYKNWVDNFPNTAGNSPLIARLYTSSDYAAFYQMFGVTSADLSYRGNAEKDERYKISPYPTYHTAYDNFDYVDRFVDPGFLAHATVARLAGAALIQQSDSLVIPFSVMPFADFVSFQVTSTLVAFSELFEAQGISTVHLQGAGDAFHSAANDFNVYINTHLDRNDPKMINAVNDRLVALEKSFIEPKGLPGQPNLRHVSGSPGSYDDISGSFPGLQDAIFQVDGAADQTAQWEVVKQQLALVTQKIHAATKLLNLEPVL